MQEHSHQENAFADGPSCVNCGAEVGKAKFCPECGTPTAPRRLTCGACGHLPEAKPKFCPECGEKMPDA